MPAKAFFMGYALIVCPANPLQEVISTRICGNLPEAKVHRGGTCSDQRGVKNASRVGRFLSLFFAHSLLSDKVDVVALHVEWHILEEYLELSCLIGHFAVSGDEDFAVGVD
jgi:hypothetical protein